MILYCRRLRRFFTFPGVILNGFLHHFFCNLLNVSVYKVKYFRMANNKMTENVCHEELSRLRTGLLIVLGPFMISSLLSMLLSFPYEYRELWGTNFISFPFPIDDIGLWLSYSIGLNAAPSKICVKNWDKLPLSSFSKFSVKIFQAIVFLFNMKFLSFFIQILYVHFMNSLLPLLFFRLMVN